MTTMMQACQSLGYKTLKDLVYDKRYTQEEKRELLLLAGYTPSSAYACHKCHNEYSEKWWHNNLGCPNCGHKE